MDTIQSLEHRLRALEEDVEALKRRLDETENGDWLSRISGRMKDFPEFEEVVRLGREFRDAQSDPEK